MICEDYVTAASVEEALATLASLRGTARLIAGGTDLVIQLQRGERTVRTLVDISRVPGLDEIWSEDSYVIIGAAATHSQIARSGLIQRQAPGLAEAVSHIGSPQIRNVGTIGGNVANAQPAADSSIALLALGAEAEIANLTGRQWVPLGQLFISPGVSRCDPTSEMITAFRFRSQAPREASAFERRARRRAVALPLINVAVRVLLDAEGTHVRDARIAMGPVDLVPFRATQAEAALKDQATNKDTIKAAAEAAMREAKPRTSLLRASQEYRRELIAVLTRRALERAIQAARG
jgi:CO/xanthine dehydrogenase FAD-binding subunit